MAPEITVTINLLEAALKELQFLELIDQRPALYNGPHLRNSIRRYELFWLPLAAQSYADEIAAPLDIAWVWHVHMLAPLQYESDCTNVVSTIVDHQLMVGKQREKGLANARTLWEQLFPKEPFEVNIQSPPRVQEYTSKIQYDIISASARQQVFYYQVSLPHYCDTKFLKAAVERYKRHLLLKKRNPETFLVPCYDFDLIWHAHQVHPLDYREDTLATLGQVLSHDDSVNDRSPDSKLITSQAKTCSLWAKAGWSFYANGALFRGVPSFAAIRLSPAGKYSTLAALTYDVELLNFEVENLETSKKYVVDFGVINGQSICKKKVRGPSATFKSEKPISRFQFHTEFNNCIQVRTFQENFCTCFGHSPCDTARILFADKLDSVSYGSSMKQTITFNDAKVVHFTTRVYPPKLARYFFVVQAQCHFTRAQNAANVLSSPKLFLSPVGLAQTAPESEMSVQRIFDYRNQEAFTYRVMHSAALLLSSVEILDLDGKVAASTHLLGNDMLPSKVQVNTEELCCTLEDGERAMLIRGQRDWGICVGKWEGFVQGVPGEPQEEGIQGDPKTPGQPGHLKVKFFSLHRERRSWQPVSREGFGYRITVAADRNASIDVNLRLGTVVFPPQVDDVPESLALGFSVAVLHLLCQPHPLKGSLTASAPATSIGDKLYKPRAIYNDELLFVVAAGYYSHLVPTNTYLNYNSGACGACGAGCGGCG